MYKREGRTNNQSRTVQIKRDVMYNAYASVEISYGNTKVLCTASIDDNVPPFAKEEDKGWLTAEYSMLPASTFSRKKRDIGKQDGRGVEIQRLIGRALRASVDLEKLKGWSIIVDCDVIQADGGTRTASITGGFCALAIAVKRMLDERLIESDPIKFRVASVSAGKVDSQIMVDLDYPEDSAAEVDYNVVMNDKGEYLEIQGTAEDGVMTRADFNGILDMCETSIKEIFSTQSKILG